MLPCCRLDIGSDKSLSVGLGKKCPRKSRLSNVEYYGEWEFGTYNAAWRIMQHGEIVTGSCYLNNETLKTNLELLFNEKLIRIRPLSEFDIRLDFSNDFGIDFFNCSSTDDEFLHVLHIDGEFWELNNKGRWESGHSLLPVKKA
jgi:hypothetical protein